MFPEKEKQHPMNVRKEEQFKVDFANARLRKYLLP